MPRAILGRKIGMTQFFAEDGRRVGVTVIETPPNKILQKKTVEKDGYSAIQLGIDDKPEKVCTKPEIGHSKAGGGTCRYVREVDLDGAEALEVGGTVTLAILDGVKKVTVTGISKGHGTAGVMKRHNFKGHTATHGIKRHHRHGGSLGMKTYPGRVLKNRKMAGHYGVERITIKGLKVAKLMQDKNLLLVNGSVPGANGAYVIVNELMGYQEPKAGKKK